MTITQMTQLIPPPRTPVLIPSEEEILQCERLLGIVFPAELVSIYNAYGACHVDDYFRFYTPASVGGGGSFFEGTLKLRCKYLTDDSHSIDIVRKYRFWPLENGCFPFCVTDGGDCLLWDPSWGGVIIIESKTRIVEEYHCSIIDFWCNYGNGKISSDILPDDMPGNGEHYAKASMPKKTR